MGHYDDLDERKIEDEVYNSQGDFSDGEEDLKEFSTNLQVVRYLKVASRDEDWRKPSRIYTYTTHESKSYKVTLNGVSCVNIISKSVLRRWSQG